MEWSDSDVVKAAIQKVRAATDAMPKPASPRDEGAKADSSGPDVSKLPYADALERCSALKDNGERADALIELSRRGDLTPQQRGRVASEALTAVSKMKLSEDRLLGLSMLSRDFVKRQEYSSAALAAQMLSDDYSNACGCGAATCKVEGNRFECVELMDAYADYLHELNIQPETMGLQNVSLEARTTVFEIEKLLGGKSGPSLLPR